jgi:hypothetical protein
MCQPTTLMWLNLCFGYFCMRNFFFCGCQKLKNTDFEDFFILQLLISLVLRFCQMCPKLGGLTSRNVLLICINLLLIALNLMSLTLLWKWQNIILLISLLVSLAHTPCSCVLNQNGG